MKPKKFTKTREALAKYDESQPARDQAWARAMSNSDVAMAQKADQEALDLVRKAFLEDTSDRNTWDQVKVVDIHFMRRMTAKE